MEGPVIGKRSRSNVAHGDLVTGLKSLDLDISKPVIVHSSLSSFGHVVGGAGAVVDALLVVFNAVMSPTFTYKTMIVPEHGPSENGLDYSRGQANNRMAAFWSPEMPADRLMGSIPEALRTHRKAKRSAHPILSFAGVGTNDLLNTQTLHNPFSPLGQLAAAGGSVLLLGVDHCVNTSLHYAELLAGRKVFTRWALTPDGIKSCNNFPGCSNGFSELADVLDPITKQVQIGAAQVLALPAGEMLAAARNAFSSEPRGYLCKRMDCGRCNAVRRMN